MSEEQVKTEVMAASSQWISHFNAGRAKACSDTYVEDAVMDAQPFGRYEGRQAIYEFWQPFLESGAGELVYRDIEIKVLDSSSAILSANWSMNVGHGYITKEKWVKQDDSQWKLVEDDFTVVENYSK